MERCLIVANSFKPQATALAGEVGAFLARHGVQAETFTYDGQAARAEAVDAPSGGYGFVVTLGGDGTVLFASRECAGHDIPVFAINLGEFGFLATIPRERWQEELAAFLAGAMPSARRFLVSCEVLREGRSVFSSLALNDVVVSSTASSRLVNLDVAYNHASLGPFKANGLIVATATGSTAYSAAAGGPILDPGLKALVLTPISSFSLSARPLVFAPEGTAHCPGELAITLLPSRECVGLTADGQRTFALRTGDAVILRIPDCTVRLAGATQEKFYAALQSKLNWAGGPRA